MKIKHLLLASAALIAGMASCTKNDGGKGLDGDFDFFMQVSQMEDTDALSRADAGQVGHNSEVTLEGGALFFINGNTDEITRYYRIDPSVGGGTVTPNQLKSGHLFTGIPAGTSKVVIVGNYPFGVTTDLTTGAAIEALTVTLKDQSDNNYGVANATLFGDSDLVPASSTNALAVQADKEAHVELGPIIARIEIVQVQGDATIDDGYKLEGIYIDDFHYTSSLTGATLSDFEDIVYSGLNSTPPVIGTSASYHLYSRATGYNNSEWYPILFDDGGTSSPGLGTAGTSPLPAKTVKPEKGAWAYNFYPDATHTPHIILHFTNMKVDDGAGGFKLFENNATGTDGEAYLTINGFLKSGGGTVSIERSNVYVLNNVLFSDSDLREEPEQPDPDPDKNKFKVYVEVELMKWNVIPVDADFN